MEGLFAVASMHRRALLIASTALVVAACGESTSPHQNQPLQLDLSGADAPALIHAGGPTGGWGVECAEDIGAHLHDASGSITWAGVGVVISDAITGQPIGFKDFDSTTTGALWGAQTLAAGASQQIHLNIWAEVPYRAHVELQYHDNGAGPQHGAVFDFHCTPGGTPLTGTYVLTSINYVPLPSFGVVSDTISFFSNLTYSARGSLGDAVATATRVTANATPYELFGDTAVSMSVLVPSLNGSGIVRRGTTTLEYVYHHGPVDEVYRFDLQGTAPSTGPSPLLVASSDSVAFTAQAAGALPAPRDVQVRSSTSGFGAEIPDLGMQSVSLCQNGVNCMDAWLDYALDAGYTPATLHLRPKSTAMPPGTYVGSIDITTDGAVNKSVRIAITLTLTP